MVPATNNQRIEVGTQVLVGKDASAVVAYDVGCSVSLKQNERLTVGAGQCCAPTGDGTSAAGAPVARLTNVQGNVLVSKDDAMVAAANNQPLAVGTRVLTTKDASVVVDYAGACSVTLKENERFTVAKGACCALPGGVVALGPAPGAIGGGVAAAPGAIGGGLVSAEVLIPIAIGGVGLYEVFKSISSD
jgi:hypothetical protein